MLSVLSGHFCDQRLQGSLCSCPSRDGGVLQGIRVVFKTWIDGLSSYRMCHTFPKAKDSHLHQTQSYSRL